MNGRRRMQTMFERENAKTIKVQRNFHFFYVKVCLKCSNLYISNSVLRFLIDFEKHIQNIRDLQSAFKMSTL